MERNKRVLNLSNVKIEERARSRASPLIATELGRNAVEQK